MRDIKIAVSRRIKKYVTEHDVPLLRLLYYTRWLRWGVFCTLFILVTVPIGLVKVWTVTPAGFNPVVKISLLDKLQSWSLRRAAQKNSVAGQFDDSVHAWHASIANDPGNQTYQREYFHFLMDQDLSRSKSRQAIQNGLWYLKLSQTNQTALELVTDVFEFYDLHEINRLFLMQHEDSLTQSMETKYLKSLFHMGDTSGFLKGIERMDSERLDADPELNLYHAAYKSMWGPSASALEHVEMLRSSQKHTQLAPLAHSLNLQVSKARGELESFRQSMDYLITKGGDRLVHHLQYWDLLVENGQRGRAVELLKQYNLPPGTATDVVRFAHFASSVGETDLAIQYLNTYALSFGYYEPVWVTYATLLTDQKDWQGLNQVALLSRRHPQASSALKGFSYFMEGRAALGEQQYAMADQWMAKAATFEYGNPSIAFLTARYLGDLGYSKEAMLLLKECPDEVREQTSYWETVFPLASKLGDSEWLLQAAENLHRLDPANLMYRNNYAALLLSNRLKPDIAVGLTLGLLLETSDHHHVEPAKHQAALINHALALALNHRYDEAVEHLKQVSEKSLPTESLSGFHLAWFEVAMRKEDYDLARSHGLLVQKDQLLPSDRDWYEATWERFLAEK